MPLETELLEKYPELGEAMVEGLKAETELHRLKAQIEKLNLDVAQRNEDNENSRMKNYGEYLFYNPIVDASVASAMVDIFGWQKKLPQGHPITITFNSPGGYVTDGFTLFDFLRSISEKGNPVTTRCIGIAASMGAILMQAGDERVMTPNAFMMIHEVSGTAEGSTSEREDQLKISKAFQAKGLDALAARSTLSRAEISKRWQRKDWYMDASEALRYGFIDHIEGAPKKRVRRKAK